LLNRLFPKNLTNAYQGSWIAVWLLTPVLIMKTLMGFNFSGLNPFIDVRQILQTVDGVPLSTFSLEATAAVVDSAGAWGMALFTLCLFAWLVLIRYRAGLPVATLLLLIEQVGRTGADTVHVISNLSASSGMPSAGALINLAMTAILAAALVLSLLPVRNAGMKS
jgi:hypothetical protein